MAQGQVVDRLVVQMVGDETKLRAALVEGQRDVDRAVTGMEASLARVNPALSGLGSSLKGLLQGIATPVGAAAVGIGGLGAAAYGLYRRGLPQLQEFNSAFRLLVSTGEDLTQAQLAATLDRIAASAGKAGGQFSRADLAGSLAELVKAGVQASQAMELLAPAMKLASVTGQSLTGAAELLLQNLRQFGLGAADASKAADALAQADLLSASNAQRLSEGLATVGPVAKAAGLSLEQTLGILVDLSNKGLDPADRGATGLRSALSTLLDPAAKGKQVLSELGISLEDANGHAKNAYDLLIQLRDALQGNADAAKIAAQVFNTRAITAILGIGKATDEYTAKIQNSTGALQNYADTFLTGNVVASQTDLAKSLDNLAEEFAQTFTPAIIDAADATTGLLTALENLHNFNWDGLVTSTAKVAKSMLGLYRFLGIGVPPNAVVTGPENLLTGGGKTGETSNLNSQGGVGNAQYGPPANPNAGPPPPAAPRLSAAELQAQAAPLVRAYEDAIRGTNATAIREANAALQAWEAKGEGQAGIALRKSIVSALQTAMTNALHGAAKDVANNVSLVPTPQGLVPPGAEGAGPAVTGRTEPGTTTIAQGRAAFGFGASGSSAGEGEVGAALRSLDDMRMRADAAARALFGYGTTGSPAGENQAGNAAKSLDDLRLRSDAAVRALFGYGTTGGPAGEPVVGAALDAADRLRSASEQAVRGFFGYGTSGSSAGENRVGAALDAADAFRAKAERAAQAIFGYGTSGSPAGENVVGAALDAADELRRKADLASKAIFGYGTSGSPAGENAVGAALAAVDDMRVAADKATRAILGAKGGGPAGEGPVYLAGAIGDAQRLANDLAARRAFGTAARTIPTPGAQLSFGLPFGGILPGRSHAEDTRYNDFTQAMFKGADRQRQASETAAALQHRAALDFVNSVDQAGNDFISAIGAFQQGNVGGGISGLAAGAGAITTAAGAGLPGAIVSVLGGIFGGFVNLFTGGNQIASENDQRAAALRASATPPALDLRFTFNQENNLGPITDPQVQAVLRQASDDAFKRFEQVLAKSIVPRLDKLDKKVGL